MLAAMPSTAFTEWAAFYNLQTPPPDDQPAQ